MKKYKLLKELPGLEAGTIIQLDGYNVKIGKGLILIEEIYDLVVFQKETLINYGWLEEIKEPKSIYELKEGDEYYYIYDKIQKLIIEDNLHKRLYEKDLEQGNVFLTKQEAEKELEKRKVLAKIKRWILENDILLSKEDGFVIHYNTLNKDFKIIDTYYVGDDIVFVNKEDAEKCLKECKQEWKILFFN